MYVSITVVTAYVLTVIDGIVNLNQNLTLSTKTGRSMNYAQIYSSRLGWEFRDRHVEISDTH